MVDRNLGFMKKSPDSNPLIANLLVRIHFIIVMIRWTGLAPWEFEFPFPGCLTSTFLDLRTNCSSGAASERRGNYLKRFKDFYLKAKARIRS